MICLFPLMQQSPEGPFQLLTASSLCRQCHCCALAITLLALLWLC